MRAGVAKVDITPPIGTDLTGFVARMVPSDRVADSLYARALALEAGATVVCIVSLDLLAVGRSTVAAVRHGLANLGGLSVMFSASHTHSGPATVTLRDCGEVSPGYLSFLVRRLVQVVAAAHESLSRSDDACSLEFAEVEADGLAVNRRRADGPIDPAVRALRVRDSGGAVRACLVNYACHGVCLCDGAISGDYISHVCRALEDASGGEAVALFLTGPSGDINPAERGREAAVAMGEGLGRSVLRAPQVAWRPAECSPMAAACREVWLPFAPLPSHEELAAWVLSQAPSMGSGNALTRKVARAMVGWAIDASRRLDRGTAATGAALEVTAFRLGSVLVIGLPGEVFTAIGTRIRWGVSQLAPGAAVIVAAHTGGTAGYVPPREEYEKGGYELEAYRWYDFPAPLAPEASEILIRTATELAAGLWREGA